MQDTPGAVDATDLPEPLRQALAYWTKLKGDRALPSRAMFDPLHVPALLPHVLMVEVIRNADDQSPKDFRFRVVGTYVDDRVKERYTGKRLSEIEGKGPGSDIWNAYCAVLEDGTPKAISLNYVGPVDGIKKSWEIFLPFSGQGTRVEFILVLLVFE